MKLYDPNKVKCVIAGVPVLGGFAPDTFIEVEFTSPDYESEVGATGLVVRSQGYDKRGKVTVHLMQGADANTLLSTVRTLGQTVGGGADIGPMSIADLNGASLWASANSWLERLPKGEFARAAKTVDWVCECEEIVGAVLNYANK